ncbi:hypothetical protein [Pedobacter chitinilyticus]|uniref:Lipoprotein n=1 Tax=Pedobacter chitinilyticus TaxID=2233776 RepID=A0A3S3R6U5_9SPHI|nr:hypothetical protein [Pedobacter chitinilyticus]RWU08194.1 hypothetical protein DPV69_07370 [Pedobacter chitinilyticus]
MRVLAAILMVTTILSCKKDREKYVSPDDGNFNVSALLSMNGQCVIEFYVYMASDPKIREYLEMDKGGAFCYACVNDSAQKMLSDTNQWNLDTLQITCRLATSEELASQCAKGKHLYLTKVTNVSIINQRRR